MKRRKFIALLGTLIFWLGSTANVSAQQPPVVGWLSPATANHTAMVPAIPALISCGSRLQSMG